MHLKVTDGILLNCFVAERKHIMVKKCCEHTRNPHQLEKACALKSWVEQRRQLQEIPRSKLIGRTHAMDQLEPGAVAALRLQLKSGLTISMDDVAVVDHGFVKVIGCIMFPDGALKLLVDPLPVVAQLGAMSYRCSVQSNWSIVAADSCLELARYWTASTADELIVLL